MTTLYGIPNCDSMKKARKWLDGHAVAYEFHDFKKAGLKPAMLKKWIRAVGWETLLNRRGMMWRRLDPSIRESIDLASATRVMLETPSIIKRPVLDFDGEIYVGFSEDQYQRLFG